MVTFKHMKEAAQGQWASPFCNCNIEQVSKKLKLLKYLLPKFETKYNFKSLIKQINIKER